MGNTLPDKSACQQSHHHQNGECAENRCHKRDICDLPKSGGNDEYPDRRRILEGI
ncbi:hypothetical protein [Megamonas hypermegale]|uniref:hypothetical protein n=1 Tax=Megamonas hypermegale TaxID=158847 RepID=UPI00195C231E|nr:hypothetical protein [Megamonas hypermegale]MBM6760471.1 hypothetical protein [Megamonas hypermegale]